VRHARHPAIQPIEKHRKTNCLGRKVEVRIPAQIPASGLDCSFKRLQQGDKS
jgi:hypothetical protein